MIDIGGGSTEYVLGVPGSEPSFHVSTQLGSVRQTERHLFTDPPQHGELEQLAGAVRATIDAAIPTDARERAGSAIAVAGTPTTLVAIEERLDPYDPERVDGARLPFYDEATV